MTTEIEMESAAWAALIVFAIWLIITGFLRLIKGDY